MSLISAISHKLLGLSVRESTTIPNDVFSGPRRVNMDIELYLSHLQESLSIDEEVLIQAYSYIMHLTESVPSFVLNAYNLPRVLLTSLLIASKYSSSRHISIRTYAEKGGIPYPDLLRMETVFLELINWDLSVSYHILPMDSIQDFNSTDDELSSREDLSFEDLKAEDNEEFSELSAFFE